MLLWVLSYIDLYIKVFSMALKISFQRSELLAKTPLALTLNCADGGNLLR